jgi:hypothetical protein
MTSSSLHQTTAIIKRTGAAAVQYDLSKPNQVTITLPVGSEWTSGLHWHENHVEYLRVIKGSISVTLGAERRTISAEDVETEVKVNHNVWHEWTRASTEGSEVVVIERTDPEDGEKTVFFWNLNGVILRVQNSPSPPYMFSWLHEWLCNLWVTLSLFIIFHDLDNIPVMMNFEKLLHSRGIPVTTRGYGSAVLQTLDRTWSHTVLSIASYLGWILRMTSVQPEYTPRKLCRDGLQQRQSA